LSRGGHFRPEFDVVALAFAVAALLILLYNGLVAKSFVQTYWVAFAFWLVGVPGSFALRLVSPAKQLSLNTVMAVVLGSGLILAVFAGLNTAYANLGPGELWLSDRFLSFSIGICEELFFGVFLLLRLPSIVAIVASSAVHAGYHVPNWGASPMILALFFISFLVARCVYVYFFPKVGVLLAAHGLWNFVVSGGGRVVGGIVAWVLSAL
jgi:hypothetical protein